MFYVVKLSRETRDLDEIPNMFYEGKRGVTFIGEKICQETITSGHPSLHHACGGSFQGRRKGMLYSSPSMNERV